MAQATAPLIDPYLPLPENLIQVPTVRQSMDFSCGAAATLTMLRYWAVPGADTLEEATLYTPLDTTAAQGTEPGPMAALLTGNGLAAEYRHGDVTVAELMRAVDRREPPIVDLQAWRDHVRPWRDTWDAGHYVVLVGYQGDLLYFADPGTGGYSYLTRDDLEERWHDVAGVLDTRVERMAIFVRGAERWEPPPATQPPSVPPLG
jgi:predicted double-glycine peptidase